MRKLTIYIWAVIIVALALILTSCDPVVFDPCFWAAGHPSRQCIEWQAKEAKK